MRFAWPHFLLMLLIGVPLLVGFYAWTGRRKRRALALFASEKLLPAIRPGASTARARGKAALTVIAFAFLSLAVARPQWGTSVEQARRTGIDLVIAIDTSRSMLAEDVKPSRLEKARQEIEGMLDRLAGDRVALVAFAGEPFLLCPLTLDYGAAKMFLDIMDTETIPTPGTDVAAAIEEARKVFDPTERKHKVLVLITDGEGHEGDPVAVAEEAAKEGVVIYTVGVGTPNGEFVPELDDQGNVAGYKKDRSGQFVRSKLDETTLEKIALLTDGKYFRASYDEMELDKIGGEIASMEKKDLESSMVVRHKDRYQWALLPAVLLLIAEAFVSERRRTNGAPWRRDMQVDRKEVR